MRKTVAASVVIFMLGVLPVFAQDAAKEAEIRAAVPYSRMLSSMPNLTLDQYNAAVRELAKGLSGRPATSGIMSTPPTQTFAASPPSLVGTDGTYLGTLSSNRYDANSVSNPYGPYGSRYSPTSINNPYSIYGSPYSPLSATNPYATQAPVIVNPYLGRLSANPYAPDSTSNRFGPYGSRFSPTSVMNPYSPYGSPYSPTSVTNPYATSPLTLPNLPSLPPLPVFPVAPPSR